MSYDSCFRILRSKLCALVVGLVALSAPAAYAQENGSPGAGGPNFAIYPRLLSSSNNWSSIQREPPCLPINSSGTVTLTLDDCPSPRNPRRLGSPAYWQINLTGNSTLAVVNQAIGQVFRVDIVANGFTLTLPNSFVLPASSPAVSGNSFIACEVHDINTYWCPGGVQAGLVAPAIWTVSNPTISAVSGGGVTSQSITLTLTSGHLLIIAESNNTGSTPSSITGTNIGTCTVFTGVAAANLSMYYCAITGTGSTTATVNFSSAVDVLTVAGFDLAGGAGSPDAGLGNVANTSASPYNVNGTGPTTQTNDFIVTAAMNVNVGSMVKGSTFTLAASNNGLLLEYQTQAATGTPTGSITGPNSSTVYNVAALTHP